jgi:hypothetical protein
MVPSISSEDMNNSKPSVTSFVRDGQAAFCQLSARRHRQRSRVKKTSTNEPLWQLFSWASVTLHMCTTVKKYSSSCVLPMYRPQRYLSPYADVPPDATTQD